MNVTIGRNDPCHCGSGKKYKKCHLEKDEVADRKEREKAALNAAKVADAATKDEAGDQPSTQQAPSHKGGPEKSGWVRKMAGKVGFFKNATQRRTPSANKNG